MNTILKKQRFTGSVQDAKIHAWNWKVSNRDEKFRKTVSNCCKTDKS